MSRSRRITDDEFKHLFDEWHPTKNGDLKLTDFTPGAKAIVWWYHIAECGCFHEWPASVKRRCHRTKPTGCSVCWGTAKVCYHRSLEYKFPDVAALWDYNANDGLDPSTISASSTTEIQWKCLIGCPYGCDHIWKVSVCDRTGTKPPTGCPYCHRSPQGVFCYHQSIEFKYFLLMWQWDYDKNIDLDPALLTQGSDLEAWWICPNTCPQGCKHEYPQRINHKICDSTGCPYCSSPPKLCCIHTSIVYTHPELASQWNKTKNKDIKPSDITSGSGLKIWWTCSRNPDHEWPATPGSRTGVNKSDCPFCFNKTEGKLHVCLQKKFPDYTIENNKWFDWCRSKTTNLPLRFDFYILELGLLIELDGEFHFQDIPSYGSSFRVVQEKDIYKMKSALDHGLRLIRIERLFFLDNIDNLDDVLYSHIIDESDPYAFICKGNEYKRHKIFLNKALRNNK